MSWASCTRAISRCVGGPQSISIRASSSRIWPAATSLFVAMPWSNSFLVSAELSLQLGSVLLCAAASSACAFASSSRLP